MLKRLILIVLATVFFALQFNVGDATALKVDESIRTVPLNEEQDTIIISNKTLSQGQRLFVNNCTKCHLQGKTKTNPNIGLGLDELAGAEPARDNLEGLVDYLQNPTTYDGEIYLDLLHPNTTRSDVFPELKNLSAEDEEALAGYMLVAPKLDPKWGGTIYN